MVTEISSKAGRPSLVIAVIPPEKPAKVASKTGAAKIAAKSGANTKSANAKPEKSKANKPIRLVDARDGR
jgi:hypothetical protein